MFVIMNRLKPRIGRMKKDNELYISNCNLICDACKTIEVDIPPPPGQSTQRKLDCSRVKVQGLPRPVNIIVETNTDGKTTATCTETALCSKLNEYVD